MSSPPPSTHPSFFLLLLPRPPTSTLFPYTTLFRSATKLPVRSFVDSHRTRIFYRFIVKFIRIKSRSEEHTSELQSRGHLVCRLLLEKKKHQRLELLSEIDLPLGVDVSAGQDSLVVD